MTSNAEPGGSGLTAEVEAFEQALRALGRLPLQKPLPLAGLTLTLVPREDGLQEKEISMELVFKKVISVRDKVRVLEQRVNASTAPTDEKLRLQARITAVYDAIRVLVAFFSDDALPAMDGDEGDADPSGAGA